jgi:transcriptional regulator with XRE-family HTH domain
MIAKTRPSNKLTVAQYLSNQIAMSGKSQKEIAEEAGYLKPNIITMMKQGATKPALNKIPALAKALGVDEVHFLRIAMEEYNPTTWEVIESVLGKHLITENEAEIVQIIRSGLQGHDVGPKSDEERDELRALVEKWRVREEKLEDAAKKNH